MAVTKQTVIKADSIQDTSGNILSEKENIFTKKTAFNKDFGKTQGTVLEGNSPAGTITNTDIDNWNITSKMYGVEWDTNQAASAVIRIGNLNLHANLPIQSLMKRCLLLDNGTVNYYLSSTDSTKKADGSNAVLDGTDGQVMVEIPEHYRKHEKEGTKERVLLSIYPISGFKKIQKTYISAYEATVERSTNKLSSVVNTTANYRGGNNNATNDANPNTLLGRPASSFSRSGFQTAARNRGSIKWNGGTHDVRLTLYYLYLIEFAERNCQLDFNPILTSQGYRQDGLGIGVTDGNGSDWNNYNGYNPFVPCGISNSLGNRSGNVTYAATGWPITKSFKVPSYRGIENPYGHLNEWVQGININIQANDSGGLSEVFIATSLVFSDTNETYFKVGNMARSNDYIKNIILGDIMPLESTGASSSTYFCDKNETYIQASGLSIRGVLSGGTANNGAAAGFGYSATTNTPSAANTSVGSRLCFLTEGV